jgi:hypothetical protein
VSIVPILSPGIQLLSTDIGFDGFFLKMSILLCSGNRKCGSRNISGWYAVPLAQRAVLSRVEDFCLPKRIIRKLQDDRNSPLMVSIFMFLQNSNVGT